MLRDITIGQYYQTKSVIHDLDPRVKIVATLAFIIFLFMVNNFTGYVVAAVYLATIIYLSHVPPAFIFRGMKAIFMLLLITVLFNVFLTPGEAIFSFWIFKMTKEGLIMASRMAIRLIFLITGSTILTLTTTPNQLTDGLEMLLNPLKKLRIPVHEIAMMMAIALRFIPILMEETDKIMKAQMARGADFETGGMIQKAKNLVPILVPLFISAFRRANDLAMAMEARCYHGGDGRTRMKPLIYKRHDFAAYIVLMLFMITMVICGRMDIFF